LLIALRFGFLQTLPYDDALAFGQYFCYYSDILAGFKYRGLDFDELASV
jgi:hypothetical protein